MNLPMVQASDNSFANSEEIIETEVQNFGDSLRRSHSKPVGKSLIKAATGKSSE